METTTIEVSDFSSRKALENHIRATYGQDYVANRSNLIIQGTKEELKALNLSARTTVFGVPCQIV